MNPLPYPLKSPCWLWPWLMALLLGAALTLLGLLLFYQTGSRSEANSPLQWHGNALQVLRGSGQVTPEGWVIPSIGASGVVLWSPPRSLNASLYDQINWQITGLDPHHPLQPIWRMISGPVHQATQPTAATTGRAALQAEPDWQGTLISVGLFIPGPVSSPLVVHSLGLRPATLTAGEWLEQLWAEWASREDWSQRSINFSAGATPRPLGSLVLLAALWAGLSSILYSFWLWPTQQPWHPAPFVTFFLVGWLLLDLRWQWELTGRLAQTQQRFAAKEATAQRLADLDGDLYRFLLDVRQHLPPQPVRLFIVNNEQSVFLAGRARYHLSPHNSRMDFRRPPGEARVGDYVLVLAMPEVHLDGSAQQLEWEGGSMAVEVLLTAPQGTLVRVRQG